MVNPELINKVNDIYSNDGQTILEMKSAPYFDKMPYDLLEEKSFKKYISDLERSVRNSFEYRELICKITNLENFVGTDEFKKLEDEDKELLTKQYGFMCNYADILVMRILREMK